MLARRSCLSVPGSSARMLEKARGLPADEVVIDLEDSVAPGAKEEARIAAGGAVLDSGWTTRSVAVRINATDSPHCYRDVIELVRSGVRCLVVPKAERAADVEFVDRLAAMVEAETGAGSRVGLQALIETAGGLRRVHEIAHASARLEALIVGYADLAASLGRRSAGPDSWNSVLDTVLVAARDAGLQAIDGPWLEIADEDGFRASAERSRALGYDGKWALHPSQVDVLNELFAPRPDEFERAVAILDALDHSESAEGRGAVMVDGAMVDEASRKLAQRVVASGEAAGMRR